MLHILFNTHNDLAAFKVDLSFYKLPLYIREHAVCVFETDEALWAGMSVQKDRIGLLTREAPVVMLQQVTDYLATYGIFDRTTTPRQRLQVLSRISENTREPVRIPAEVMTWIRSVAEKGGE